MNVKYRLTALFMAVVMLLSVCLAAVAEDVDGGITKQEYDQNVDAALDVFYAQLMAAETYEEFSTLISRMSQDQLNTIAAMFSDEYNASLNAKVADLLSAYATDEGQEVEEEEPFVSEILYVTVPYTRVAAFKAPVVGTSTSKARTMAVSSASYALTPRATGTNDNNGLELSKSVVQNADGSYTLTLEAYATGSKVITEVKKDVPTDIVLVLDQSGSMAEKMNTYGFSAYSGKSNSNYYDLRHNGGSKNLYYKLDDGSYASVAVTVVEGQGTITYTVIKNGRNNSTGLINNYTSYWANRNNLYAFVNEKYEKVTVTRTGDQWYNYNYTYTLPDGVVISTSKGDLESPTFTGITGNQLYLGTTTVDTTKNVYTYTYTDDNGVTQTIGASTGASTQPMEFTLYERNQTGTTTRLAALKNAVNTFVSSVNAKAAGADGTLGTEDDINHRIAVVGYASRADSNDPWVNTELFIGSNQYNYNVNAKNYYGQAFQNMNTQTGRNNVNASINALAANGATYTNYGLEMANGIMGAYPLGENEKRNRVIILFTDGYPGKNADDFNQTAADSALSQASIAKNAGISLYSVGIFTGADATTTGNKNGTNTEAANWFMQQVSSNNGKVQRPSYYLSAADANDLNSIFQQIANNIETGGSSSTLSESAVVRDIIAPSFTLPEGATTADITIETYSYTDENTWANNNSTMGATATITGRQVDVTGFDFSENWVGTVDNNGKTEYRGNKLVIQIPIEVRDGFLGGNNVLTNGDASGVYESSTSMEPIEKFVSPEVNVPIADIYVVPQDKNIYLLGDVDSGEMLAGASITCGTVAINPSSTATNYGLQDWQNAYVDIKIGTSDALSGRTEDGTYTVTCTIEPTNAATGSVGTAATEKTGNGYGSVNVFKPEVTYQDSKVKYLDPVTDISSYHATNNLIRVVWMHESTADNAVTMIGPAPTLTYSYSPVPENWVTGGKITSTEDVAVNVAYAIGNVDVTGHTTTVRQACTLSDVECNHTTSESSGLAGTHDPEFVVHVYDVLTTLTIRKSGMEDPLDNGQSFLFRVTGANLPEEGLLIAINENGSETISGLLVGSTYIVTEVPGWSWRYTAEPVTSGALVADGQLNSVTVENTRVKDKWLDGDCYAENVFNKQTGN